MTVLLYFGLRAGLCGESFEEVVEDSLGRRSEVGGECGAFAEVRACGVAVDAILFANPTQRAVLQIF